MTTAKTQHSKANLRDHTLRWKKERVVSATKLRDEGFIWDGFVGGSAADCDWDRPAATSDVGESTSIQTAVSATSARQGFSEKSRNCQAFVRELRVLCAERTNHGRWFLYVGGECSKIADSKRELIRVCNAQGLKSSDYFIGYVDDVAEKDFVSGEIEISDFDDDVFVS